MNVIAISGFISSGKDSVAGYLISKYGYTRESLAGSLKDATSAIFNWPRNMLEGDTADSRLWRETEDEWWADNLDMPGLTPRIVLQQLGTEVFRNNFHSDIWLLSLKNRLLGNYNNVVITDCRFPNEISLIKSLGGKLVWVKRGPLPEWYNLALEYNTDNDQDKFDKLNNFYKVHPSEYKWIGSNFDYIIENNSDLTTLYAEVDKIVQNI